MNSSGYSLSRPPGAGPGGLGGGTAFAGPPVPLVGPPNPSGSGRMSQIPQGSKLATYMKSGFAPSTAAAPSAVASSSGSLPPTHLPPPTMELKKLAISGIQEFVPSNRSSYTGGFRSSASPRESPTPINQVVSSASAQDLNGESSSSAADTQAVNTYSDGGTMYFYQGEDMIDPTANGGASMVTSSVMSANYTIFQGTPNFVAELRTQSNIPNSAAESDIKADILKRQSVCLTQVDPESNPGIPAEVDGFANFCPLEPPPPTPMHKSHTFGYVTSVYKANSVKDGSQNCIRRVQNFRLTNSKCMVLVEQWKKLSHSNIVALRQVFTSKVFGDQSMLFVYDFFPGAETLMAKHFTQTPTIYDQFGYPTTTDFSSMKLASSSSKFTPKTAQNQGSNQLTQNGLLSEDIIWQYVIQLTSALRHIHTAGLACRTLDPTKILVINKTRLLLNCCGMFDVLTFDPTASNPMAAMAHYQQEDLIALGKIVLALACNSFLAIQRENLQSSMEMVTTNYSSDMRNLIMYLLTNPNRVKSVNDLMPMIGARFYVTLDEANKRMDEMDAEMSKDVECARLFRLLTKLCTVVDRAELNGDESWSEYGDRYMLKLFRDYVFHQVMEDGRPWLDMAHVVSCLNKFDTGVCDKICLMSRDEQNVLVVSYAELKECLVQSYAECIQSAKPNSTYSSNY